MLEHGGQLAAAAKQYGIPLENWLDLSTGINPVGYPIPDIPASTWQRLPQDDDGLKSAAAVYYGSAHILPAAGTQAILQVLPRLRAPCRVVMPAPTYAEHPKAWGSASHTVTRVAPENATQEARNCDVLLLCNPNNPTGYRYSRNELLACHAELATRGGWLVVDEAFIDATPEHSLTPHIGLPGLVILRSLGKFFGLAGARVGFALAWPELLARLEELLGPWPISGPARHVAQLALSDTIWQSQERLRLPIDARRLAALLAQHDLAPNGGTALFQWVQTPHAPELHERLVQHSILSRLFDEPSSLRFGLPAAESDWGTLENALKMMN